MGRVAYSLVPVLVVSTLGQCTVEFCQDPERKEQSGSAVTVVEHLYSHNFSTVDPMSTF